MVYIILNLFTSVYNSEQSLIRMFFRLCCIITYNVKYKFFY